MERKEDFIKQILPRYRSAHVSKIVGWEDEMRALEEWIRNPKNFLILIGVSGCGKTYVSVALAFYLFEIKEKDSNSVPYLDIQFVKLRDFFDHLKALYSKNKDDSNIKEILSNCAFLILDDLGASRNTEWQKEVILDIIDRRYDNMLPTIITTNFNFREIKEIFGSRVSSRLEASENFILEKWDRDLRLEGK